MRVPYSSINGIVSINTLLNLKWVLRTSYLIVSSKSLPSMQNGCYLKKFDSSRNYNICIWSRELCKQNIAILLSKFNFAYSVLFFSNSSFNSLI